MTGSFGKAHYLILDRGAISGTYAVYPARIKRGTVDILTDSFVSFVICVSHIAGNYIFKILSWSFKGKWLDILIAVLAFEKVKVNASLMHTEGVPVLNRLR